jgi:hypothetical protein
MGEEVRLRDVEQGDLEEPTRPLYADPHPGNTGDEEPP